MKLLPPENKKYVTKFGMIRTSGMDWHRDSLKPLARCSFCVRQYGEAPKHDHLTLETMGIRNYLCCARHRGRKRA